MVKLQLERAAEGNEMPLNESDNQEKLFGLVKGTSTDVRALVFTVTSRQCWMSDVPGGSYWTGTYERKNWAGSLVL